ncbi:MAG: hypothetical protein KAV82_04000 [Phycisphaerae bacterium]|nr:hypothetical protein [Phycisphaerae bacterium]
MNQECRMRGEGGSWSRYLFVGLIVAIAGAVTPGCSRVLTIEQADHINTAMFTRSDRGEPLEVNIVCVTPNDLKREENDRLKPDSGITAEEWFRRRPISGDKKDKDWEGRGDRFYLPKDQVFTLTDRKEDYGTHVGVRLRGKVVDRKDTVTAKFSFKGPLHNDLSVIYVFAKFIDREGKVMAVPPARFHPPGAYTHELVCEIGVDESAYPEHYGQYIKIDEKKCVRKLHGKGEKAEE